MTESISKKQKISILLNEYPEYQEQLFRKGYLITTNNNLNIRDYPFYGNWNYRALGVNKKGIPINMYVQEKEDYYYISENSLNISIIGHAYNPFNMVSKEDELLKLLLAAYKNSTSDFFDLVNELTGIHVIVVNDNGKLIVVQDCTGMKSCYFGKFEEDLYISSHPQLLGDVLNLEVDSFISELINNRQYNIGNKHLPGNMSPYKEFKRLGGNTYIKYSTSFSINRFFPLKPHKEINNDKDYIDGISEIGEILHKNIKLAMEKWRKPAISMTGGMDSKTTLAAANGLYDSFKYFSFYSKEPEKVDAEAAREICNNLDLKHNIYPIPDNNSEVKDFEVHKSIIDHNTSYFKNTADNEIRKMVFLYELNDFDVELKSWASEIGRVFLERKYQLEMPEKLTARHFSIFQTRYFLSPKLLKKSDDIYTQFLNEIKLDKPLFNYEHADLYYWEVRMGAWGASVSTSFEYCHNVTIPFNNRKLMDMFLSFPHEERKLDKVHKQVIELMNPKINDMNIVVKNLYFHSYRTLLEKIYYYYRTWFNKK